MRPRPRVALARALEKKGFLPRQSHHTFYHLYVEGRRRPIHTKLSHGARHREYGVGLLRQMAQELHLDTAELDRFLECPLTYDSYVRLMRERGHLE